MPKSSTAQTLISMVHAWFKYGDGNDATVRVLLFDFRKAFDQCACPSEQQCLNPFELSSIATVAFVLVVNYAYRRNPRNALELDLVF